jgi:peptidoglycan/LPS O-acetylase OafA/YrhL
MVHIFFVISGFALSYKPVKELHARNLDKCYSALASSTFRRPLRLFGPCVVSTFLVLCLRQMGYIIPGEKTLLEEFRSWKEAVFHQITWPWDWDRDLAPNYDIHLWTIPIEFAHSMLLFVVLLMLSRVRLGIRIATVFGLMMYCLTCGKWAGFEFLAGLLLAEIHILKSTRTKELELSDVGRVRNPSGHWLISVLHISLILFGLFIGGWPNENADKTPGIRFFLQHTPMPFATMDALAPQKFWFALSAVAIVWAAGELDGVRKFFEGPFAQYCGRVSYAVYICHGPVGNVFHERLLGHPPLPAHGAPTAADFKPAVPAAGVKGYFGVETQREVVISWFIGLCLVGSLVVWAADVFWRAIDSPIVNLARKLENLCLDDPEPSPQSQGYSLAG